MDWLEHQRATLRHCLQFAAVDPEYAQWAADRYERESCGVLVGLGEKVRAAIAKHTPGRGVPREALPPQAPRAQGG